MTRPLIVNLFGAPSSGKSTNAMLLTANLKMLGYEAEYVSEYAKDLVWEKNIQKIKNQNILFAEQEWMMRKLLNHQLDFIICDSPLLLNILYARYYNSMSESTLEVFEEYVLKMFKSYENVNFLLERDFEYRQIGRIHSKSESEGIHNSIKELLNSYNISHKTIKSNERTYEQLIRKTVEIKKNYLF